MNIAQLIQSAWQKQSAWLIVFRPLSWLYGVLFRFNRYLYQRGIKSSYRSPVPVMVVGNITVGGSGKTPLLINLVKYLQKHHIQVAVISRGYGGQGEFPALVNISSTPKQVGDEPCLIVQATQVPMVVVANRQQAIELVLQHYPQTQLILSDDGLQHWALQRDLEWIVLDLMRGLGNERLLPEGFLREPKQRLDHATVIEHQPHSTAKLHMHLAVGQPYLLFPEQFPEIHHFSPNQHFHAVVGIGYPKRFYQTLNDIGVTQFVAHDFADHHNYTLQDIDFNDDLSIITTEKDAVKLRIILQQSANLKHYPPIWVVPVEAVLSESCYTLLMSQLAEHGIQSKI